MTIPDRVATIIREKGQTVTFREKTASVLNTSTLQKAITFTDTVVTAHLRLYKDNELSGLVQEGDKELRIGAESISFDPTEQDKVVIKGEEYNIVRIDLRSHENVDVEYIIQIRGSRARPNI